MRGSWWWWWWWWWWRSSKGTGYQGGACRAIFKTQTDGTNRQVQSKYRQVGAGSRQKQCIPTSQPFWPLGSKAYWAWTIEPLHGLPQKSASVVAVCLLRFSWFGVFGYVCFVFFLGFWLFHSNSQLFEFILTTPHPAKSNKQGPVAATRRRCRSHKQKKRQSSKNCKRKRKSNKKQQKQKREKQQTWQRMTKKESKKIPSFVSLPACFCACLFVEFLSLHTSRFTTQIWQGCFFEDNAPECNAWSSQKNQEKLIEEWRRMYCTCKIKDGTTRNKNDLWKGESFLKCWKVSRWKRNKYYDTDDTNTVT